MRFLHFLTGLVHSHKRWLFFVWSTIVVWFLWSDVGFATTGGTPANSQKETTIVDIINGILGVAGVILGILSQLIAAMIHPQWTSGDIVGLRGTGTGEDILHKMWILVSNVIYFIFALIFVSIAFLTIYKGESYQLKEKLPRFIAGVLIVPFSWFFVQFVISISSLLTFSIIALPFDTFKPDDKTWTDKKICTNWIIDVSAKDKDAVSKCADKDDKKKSLKEIMNDQFPMAGIMTIYTTQIISIENATKLKTDQGLPRNLSNIILSLGFDTIFVVVYVIMIVMLSLALLVRGVYMWIYAMGAPFFGILFFFKDMKNERFNLQAFLHLAMVPVYVCGVLSFGLLFILSTGKGLSGENEKLQNMQDNVLFVTPWNATGTNDKQEEVGSGTIIAGKGSNNPVTIEIKGIPQTAFPKGTGIFEGVQNSIGVFIIRIFGIVFLWMGLIMALEKGGKVTESIVAPFKSLGDSVGSMLAKAPINTPIIPTGTKHGNVSISGLSKIGSTLEGVFSQVGEKAAIGIGEDIRKHFGLSGVLDSLQKLGQQTASTVDALKTAQTMMQQGMSSEAEFKRMQDGVKDPKIRAILESVMGKTGVEELLKAKNRADFEAHTGKNSAAALEYASLGTSISSGISWGSFRGSASTSGGDTSTTPSFDIRQLKPTGGTSPLQWSYHGETVTFPASTDTNLDATIATKLNSLGIPKTAVDDEVLKKIYGDPLPRTIPRVRDIQDKM